MTELLKDNLELSERVLRTLIGIAFIGAGAGLTDAAHWIVLFAVYPIFTAIVSWDPLYALYRAATKRLLRRPPPIYKPGQHKKATYPHL